MNNFTIMELNNLKKINWTERNMFIDFMILWTLRAAWEQEINIHILPERSQPLEGPRV